MLMLKAFSKSGNESTELLLYPELYMTPQAPLHLCWEKQRSEKRLSKVLSLLG